jgi:putative FmdB family regulatory protein
MPIFEYRCNNCNSRFELLVRSDEKISCPECHGEKTTKLFSPFASHIKRSPASNPTCYSGTPGCDLGKCGSGFCGVD